MSDSTASRKTKPRFALFKALFRREQKQTPPSPPTEPSPTTQSNGEGDDAISVPQDPSTTQRQDAPPASSLDEPAPQPVSRPASPSQPNTTSDFAHARLPSPRPTSCDSHSGAAPAEITFFGNIEPQAASFDLQLLHLKGSPASSLDLVPQLKQQHHQPGPSLASIPDSPLDPFYRGPLPAEPTDSSSPSTPTTPTTPTQWSQALAAACTRLKTTLSKRDTAESDVNAHFAALQAAQHRLATLVTHCDIDTRKVHHVLETAKQAGVSLQVPDEFKSLPGPTAPSRRSVASLEENDHVGPLLFKGRRAPLTVENAL